MIKYCTFLVSFLFLAPALSAQVNDDFSDGDFTSDPAWTGDVDDFVVNDNFELQLSTSGEGESYLSTLHNLNELEDREWRMRIKYGFSPSDNNRGVTYLTATDDNFNSSPDGIYLSIGESGSDDPIRLFERIGGTENEILSSTPGIVASSFDISVRIIYRSNGDWELYYDLSAGENYQSDAVANNPVAIVGEHFGFWTKYTASNSENFVFDDIYVGEIIVDTSPPVVESVEVLSSNELLVIFSEPLDQTSAEDPNNFDLQPFLGSPMSAELNPENNMEITLEFATEMVNGNSYNLLVNGVADLNGNIMEPESFEFLFVIPEEADFRDVVINEIMFDPTPVVGDLPEAEYIEIYNVSDKYIQLQNWLLVNTTTERSLPEHLLEPGAFAILTHPDAVSQFEPYGDVIGIASFVALANTGDSLTLINEEGLVIDIVNYSDSWYNDPDKADGGWSLELINPETPCSGSQNWTASNDPGGGTPGEQNSVYDTTPDTNPPALVDFSIIDNQNLLLFFNESLDETSVENATVTIEPETAVADISLNDDQSVHLVLETPIDTAVNYTVTIEGITDCIGNIITENNSIVFMIGHTPGEFQVLINEIFPDPSPVVGLPENEYIELYNPTDQLFDLSGGALSGAVFPENTFIAAGEYLILVAEGVAPAFEEYGSVVEMQDMSSVFLTNSGRELVLMNEFGETIDRVEYDLSWYGDQAKTDGGWSLERINPEEPCRAGDNWRASVDQQGGTPGSQNSVFDTTPDELNPHLETILVLDSVTIELVFNEVLDLESVISAGYEFSPELTVFDIQIVSPQNQRIILTLAESLQPNEIHTISIFGLTDCTGNEYENSSDAVFGLPGANAEANLILNEVLFNQRTGGADFVEIYNHGNTIVSLAGWHLGNLANDQIRLITEEEFILLPGDYLAITDNKANILAEYPSAVESQVFEAEDIPTYNNGDGQVVLINPQGENVDRFDYFEEMHFAMLNDFKGVSLERISFDRPTDDATNWASASELYNWATPGFQNSQFQAPVETNDEVAIVPEIFSPDNDGYQDVVNIQYQFDRSGLTGNITIYDAAGREIRKLMRNEYLGSEGSISWDGITDDGKRARVGIHIIYMEVFSADGYTEGYKRSCVVASRF